MLDGGKSEPPAMLGVSSPNEGRAAVRDLKAKSADFIKVLSRLDRETYFAIAAESKKQGMTFVGHVPNALNASEASAAGQKSIEHIFYSNLTFDCSAQGDELRRKSSEARAKRDSAGAAAARDEANASFSREKANTLWQTFVRNRTWVVLTLVAMRTTAQQREAARRDLPGRPICRRRFARAGHLTRSTNKCHPRLQNDISLSSKRHEARARHA